MSNQPTRVSCWPRPVLERITPPPGAILISVYDRSEEPLSAHPGWADVLKLRFHDTDGSQMGLEVFSSEHAAAVLQFLQRHPHCSEIFVHCAAGQSRSAAIAMFIGEAFGLPIYKQNLPLPSSYALYNRKVYRTLHEAFMDAQQ
jgi:predicted protein tyrosine phosphatase